MYNGKTTNSNKIPEDLVRFLRSEGGRSLIIRGGPGTGKTTFALELAESLRERFNTHYISSRIGDLSLYEHFPWLKDQAISANRPLVHGQSDALAAEPAPEEKLDRLKNPHIRTVVDRTELDKLEARVEAGEEFFEDGISEEGNPPIYEEGALTFDIAMILPEIDLIYDTIERHLPRKSLIMIDSIEALSEKYGISAKKLIYTMQKDLVENTKTNVAFILEKTKSSDLEFLADGVLNMEMSEYDGRRIRMMNILKLRGVHIKRPRVLFSLVNGRFNSFDLVPSTPSSTQAAGDKFDDRGTGISEVEKLANGFGDASINLFEFGDGVDNRIIEWLTGQLILKSVLQGRGTYVMLPERMSSRYLFECLDNLGIPEENKRVLHLLEVAEIGGSIRSGNVISLEGDDIINDFRWGRIKHSLVGTGAKEPFTFIAGFDTLKSIYGRDGYLGMVRHISILRKNGGSFFGLGWSSSKETQKFSNYTHNHLKLESINGYQILFGIRPYSGTYHIDLKPGPSRTETLSTVPIL